MSKSTTNIQFTGTLELSHTDLGYELEFIGIKNTEDNQQLLANVIEKIIQTNQITLHDIVKLYKGDYKNLVDILYSTFMYIEDMPFCSMTYLQLVCQLKEESKC